MPYYRGPVSLSFLMQDGWSPLMLASSRGNSAVVAELLSHGADVGLCTHKVWPLFHFCYEIITSTLQSGFSSLMLSTNKGHLQVVKMLLKAEAPVNCKEKVSTLS